MSDDIDIEEHDVMDHVAVKEAFPDLSIIKQEVLDLDYDEVTPESERQTQENSPSKGFSIEVHNADSTTDLPEHHPVSESPRIVSSSAEVNRPNHHYGNRIIIGENTGSTENHAIEKLKEEARNIKTKVVLNDWGAYLRNSKSYCDKCKILFPVENVYDYHKMVAHSHLVAVQKEVCREIIDYYDINGRIDWRKLINVRPNDFECNICHNTFKKRCYIYKHCLNVHKVKLRKVDVHGGSNVSVARKSTAYSLHHSGSINSREPSTSFSGKSTVDAERSTNVKSHTCQLCKQSFESKDLLLNHLYEQHFPAKPYKCDTCDLNFTTKDNLNKHQCNKLIVGDEEVTSKGNLYGYQCKICMSYFLSNFNLLYHLSHYHKQCLTSLPDSYEKSKITLTCPFCSKSRSTKSQYNIHIKTEHPDKAFALFNSKEAFCETDVVKKKLYTPTNITRVSNGYKCMICYKIFTSYKSAYTHKSKQHPNLNKQVIKKVRTVNRLDSKLPVMDIEKPNPQIMNVSNSNKVILIPKHIVYKCSECSIHSTSIVDIETHMIEHENDSDFMKTKKCDKCNLHFTLTSLNLHVHQHDYSKEFSIIIVDISDLFLGKLLHKCPKCAVHFSESNLMGHYENCKKSTQNHDICNQCDLVIENSLYNYHQRCHTLNYIREDFIIINYICLDPNDQSSVNINIQYMYCDLCKCYTHKKEKKHTLGMCMNIPKDICQTCGIMLPEKLFQDHLKLHSAMKKLTFNDFSFYKISDGKPMSPVIPEFPKCAKCKIHFESISAKTEHACNTVPSINCQICDINLTVKAHRLHNFYHSYKKPGLKTTPKILPKCENKIILFLCKNCNVAIDDYDDVIVHCQKHDSIPNFRMDYKSCKMCDLNFDVPSYERHFQKHTKYNISKEDFTMITYDQYQFASQQWFKKLLSNQTDGRLAAAINRSIHKYTKFVKLHLFKSGNTELTLYKCSICDTAVSSKAVQKHTDKYSNGNCKNVPKVQCKICNLKFIGSLALKHHKEHFNHRLKDSYRIVKFNYANDRVYNRNLLRQWHCNATKCKYVYYLCRNCEVAMPKSLSEKHNCATSESLATKCIKCDLLINNTAIKGHMLKHKESPDFVRNNIKVVIFGNTLKLKINLYQCVGCKCVLLTRKNFNRHAAHCGNQVIKRCPHCKLFFNIRSIERHMIKHVESPDYTLENFNVIPFGSGVGINKVKTIKTHKTSGTNKKVVKKYIFYQCRTCGSALASQQAVRRHSDCIENCKDLKTKLIKCSLCSLKFFNSIASHMSRHQLYPDMNKDSIKIVPFGDSRDTDESDVESDAVSQKSSNNQYQAPVPEKSPKTFMPEKNRSKDKKYTIYKCRSCKVCVLTSSGVRKHDFSTHLTQYDFRKECKRCGCSFAKPYKSFMHHNMLHDKYDDYNIDNIKIVDFGPEPGDNTKRKHDGNVATSNNGNVMDFDTQPGGTKRTKRDGSVATSDNIETIDFESERSSTRKRKHDGSVATSDNLETIDFESERSSTRKRKHDGSVATSSDSAEKTAKLFKCSCGVHFLTRRHIENHLCLCAGDQTVKQNCSRCGLAFTPESLFSHLCTHHGNNKVNYKYDVIEMGSDNGNVDHTLYYKCIKCSTHFNRELNAKAHVSCCSNILGTSVYCYRCKLYFHDLIINDHNDLHAKCESKINFKVVTIRKKSDNTKDDVTDITIENNDQVTLPTGEYMIYKCIPCDNHYINKMSIMKHLNIPHKTKLSNNISVCNICDLPFNNRGLKFHKKLHHTNGYIPKSYAVEEFDGSSKIPLGIRDIDISRKERADNTLELDKDSSSEEIESKTSNLDNTSEFELNVSNELETESKTSNLDNTSEFELNVSNELETVNEIQKSTAVEVEDKNNSIGEVKSKITDTEVSTDVEECKIKKKVVSNILYKCSECNVHYLKEATVNKHTLKNHKVIHPSDIFECKFCGLNFRALTLTPHNRQHHYDNKFELKDFIIHEYEPVTRETVLKNKKATQKISIYNAIDANKETEHNESSCVINNKPVNIFKQNDIKLNANRENTSTDEIINNTNSSVYSSEQIVINILDKSEEMINYTENTDAQPIVIDDNNYSDDKALDTTNNITQNTDCIKACTVNFEPKIMNTVANYQEIIVFTGSETSSTQPSMHDKIKNEVIDNTERSVNISKLNVINGCEINPIDKKNNEIANNAEARSIDINNSTGQIFTADKELITRDNFTQNTEFSEISTVNFEPGFLKEVANDHEIITITDSRSSSTQSMYESTDNDVIDTTEEIINDKDNTAINSKPNGASRNEISTTDKPNDVIDRKPKLITIDNTTLNTMYNITHNTYSSDTSTIKVEPTIINKIANDQEVIVITDSRPSSIQSMYENTDNTKEILNYINNSATNSTSNVGNRNEINTTDKSNETIDTETKLITVGNSTLNTIDNVTHNTDSSEVSIVKVENDEEIIVISDSEPLTQSSMYENTEEQKPYHCNLCHKRYISREVRDIHICLDHRDVEKTSLYM